MARIVPHGALLGRDAESIGNPLCRPLVLRRENDADVAVIEDRTMLAVGFIDLIETLGDQIDPDPVARHERSEEHTSELQSLMRISYAGFCLKKNKKSDRSTQS